MHLLLLMNFMLDVIRKCFTEFNGTGSNKKYKMEIYEISGIRTRNL